MRAYVSAHVCMVCVCIVCVCVCVVCPNGEGYLWFLLVEGLLVGSHLAGVFMHVYDSVCVRM